MLARSKLKNKESETSEALINNVIGHEDSMAIINELKGSIKKMKSQRKGAKKINLIEKGKKKGIDEVIKHNEIINNSLKFQI